MKPKQTANICSDFHASSYWFLLHDNAPAHTSMSICEFLAKKVTVFHNSPYLPDLALVYYLLFPKLKLKGSWFDDVSIIQKNVTMELKAITEEEYNML